MVPFLAARETNLVMFSGVESSLELVCFQDVDFVAEKNFSTNMTNWFNGIFAIKVVAIHRVTYMYKNNN